MSLRHSVYTIYHMGWLRSVGSLKWQVSFAKEPYKRDDIPQRRPVILSILLTVATPYENSVSLCPRRCIHTHRLYANSILQGGEDS